MAFEINLDNFTVSDQEAKALIDKISHIVFDVGDLARTHAIIQGITKRTQIASLNDFNSGYRESNGCTPNERLGLSVSEKWWEPKLFDVRDKICQSDFAGLRLQLSELKRVNPDYFTDTGHPLMQMIFAKILRYLPIDVNRKVWFADTNAKYSSQGGNFTEGIVLDEHNGIDGLWTQAEIAVADDKMKCVEITETSGTTAIDQMITPAKAAAYFDALIDNATPTLLSAQGAKIVASGKLARAYARYLRDNATSNGFLERQENGKTTITHEGYEVEVRHDWDAFINANMVVGANKVAYNPHRAMFTTKTNIPIATASEGDFKALEVNKLVETMKGIAIDTAYMLDAKIIDEDLTVVAF